MIECSENTRAQAADIAGWLIDEVDIMEIQRSAWNYGGRLMTEKHTFSCIRKSAGGFYPAGQCRSCACRLDFHLLLLMLLQLVSLRHRLFPLEFLRAACKSTIWRL